MGALANELQKREERKAKKEKRKERQSTEFQRIQRGISFFKQSTKKYRKEDWGNTRSLQKIKRYCKKKQLHKDGPLILGNSLNQQKQKMRVNTEELQRCKKIHQIMQDDVITNPNDIWNVNYGPLEASLQTAMRLIKFELFQIQHIDAVKVLQPYAADET